MPRDTQRWKFATLSVILLGLAFGVGCSSTGSSTAESEEPAPVIAPKEGMTKQQIMEMYQGEPDTRTVSSDGGEIWHYHMNAGEAWIPYNFGYRPEYHVIEFNKDGLVEKYTLSE